MTQWRNIKLREQSNVTEKIYIKREQERGNVITETKLEMK